VHGKKIRLTKQNSNSCSRLIWCWYTTTFKKAVRKSDKGKT